MTHDDTAKAASPDSDSASQEFVSATQHATVAVMAVTKFLGAAGLAMLTLSLIGSALIAFYLYPGQFLNEGHRYHRWHLGDKLHQRLDLAPSQIDDVWLALLPDNDPARQHGLARVCIHDAISGASNDRFIYFVYSRRGWLRGGYRTWEVDPALLPEYWKHQTSDSFEETHGHILAMISKP